MINLHEPRFTLEDEKIVVETLRSTWVSTGGPFVDQFEREFAEYVGSKHAISVSSGTIALQLGIEVLKRLKKIQKPFDVLVPTLSFIATSNAVIHAGGTPIFIDTASKSVNIDPSSVLRTIRTYYSQTSSGELLNKETGNLLLCIMPAHIMGWCCNMTAIDQISESYGLPVIEDAAEALGSFYLDGRHLGKSSLAAAFSFNGNKILTTGGGGMLVTDDDDFAKLAKHLSTTAKTDGLRYIHDQVGYNFRMVNILAALGVSQLARLSGSLVSKKEIAATYKSELARIGIRTFEEQNNLPNNWIVNVFFDSELERERALTGLNGRQIQVRPLWTPAHRLPFMSPTNTFGQSFPNADDMWKRILSIPSSPHLTKEEIDTVVGAIKESFS